MKWTASALVILFFLCAVVHAQSNWKLKLERDGIKIYEKNAAQSPLKAIKAVCTLSTSLTALTAVLIDIDRTTDWVYATKNVKLLKVNSASDLIYYSQVDLPWPVSDRDFIVELSIEQDPVSHVVRVLGINKPRYLPTIKDIIRVESSYSLWLITPTGKGQVRVEYELQVDPGGSVPVWLTNLFATKGPFNTFQKLRDQVNQPEYHHRRLPFIED